MHHITIEDLPLRELSGGDVVAVKRIMLCLRERLDNISCDVISLVRTFDMPPGAIGELAAGLLDDDGSDEPQVAAPIWQAQRTAYLLTAAVADGDQAEADALWNPLDRNAQADLLLALAAQATNHLRTALADTKADRSALAGALARMSVDTATARSVLRDAFAEMCRNNAGR